MYAYTQRCHLLAAARGVLIFMNGYMNVHVYVYSRAVLIVQRAPYPKKHSGLAAYMQTHIHTRIIYTHISNTHTYTNTEYKHRDTCIHAYLIHTHVYTNTTYSLMQTSSAGTARMIFLYVHTHRSHTHMLTQIIHTHMQLSGGVSLTESLVCTHTHIFTHILTHILHTHIHTHMHTQAAGSA